MWKYSSFHEVIELLQFILVAIIDIDVSIDILYICTIVQLTRKFRLIHDGEKKKRFCV